MKKISHSPKADNLKRLLEANFNVPKYYVISPIDKENFGLSSTQKKLQKAYEKWLDTQGISSVAVRSSSDSEDSANRSFAGQFKTVLDVTKSEDFLVALKTVLFSKSHTEYSTKAANVSAIVQEFIEPDMAGVLFSINPANGNNEIVINAAVGRGVNVVDGKQAEQYFVDRFSFNYVVGNDNKKAILKKYLVEKLCILALDIELLFGHPQDIEWAIKDNKIYILQSRPITNINHLKVWDSSNLAESFPGIVLPLTFSIAKRGYMLAYKAQSYSAGLNWYELEKHHRTFDGMVGIFNGRMYYNLINWYKFIALFPGSKRNQKFLDAQIATQGEAVHQSSAKQSITFRIKFFIRIIYRIIFFNRELKSFYKKLTTLDSELSRMPQTGDSQLLMERYAHIEATISLFGRSVDNDFFVMTYHGWLKKLLTKWLPTQAVERNYIIGSIKGVLSAEQALALYALAKDFRKNTTALKLLEKNDYVALDEYLKGTTLQNAIEDYKENFGHRFAEDQKIESVNPTLAPHGMYELIKVYVQLDHKQIEKRLSQSDERLGHAEKLIETNLSIFQRMLYKLLLGRLKHHLRVRERNRLLRGRVYGYLRELFPEVGQALVNEGVLQQKDDVYYLQIDEIYQLLQASLTMNDLADRIKQRRNAYKKFTKIKMPERFITTALPSLEKIKTPPRSGLSSKVNNRLSGLISSPGTIEGRAIVLDEPIIPDQPYDILIARHTDPGWTPLIALAKGVVVEYGGMLSHAAIVTRELGIPSIIGVKDVTSLVESGMHVRINTQTSSLEILD